MVKYGHGDFLKNAAVIDDPLEYAPPPVTPPEARQLTDDLEALGPTFIKLGQLISTRSDFVPDAYMAALAKLQDKVKPFPFSEVEAIVAVEIGARISRAFIEFESTPMAGASLGQVHRAILRNGTPVAVKVQRPNVREMVAEDLEAMREIAGFLDKHSDFGKRFEFSNIVEELRKSLLRELDYRQEATNLKLMREHLGEFSNLLVPAPIDDYSSGRVLTMEYVSGRKITKLSPLAKIDIDGPALAEELFRAYLHQILVTGFFHADPHPGNVFITEDHRLALLDLGMVARIGPDLQEQLLRLLLAISGGESDRAADIAAKMGMPKDGFDDFEFRRRMGDIVAAHKNATVSEMQIGKVVMAVNKVSGDCKLSVPAELTLLGKTLLNLDLVGRTLCPEFNPNESIQRNAGKILQDRTLRSLSPGNLLATFLEAKEFVEKLPVRLNRLLEMASSNKLKINVDAIDENLLMAGLQKVANRITLGLILAALIIGAAMLMQVETQFRIFGYPGLAILCFLLASAGGVALAIQILRSDTHLHK